MALDAGNSGLESFLAAHAPVDVSAAFASGDQFGDWRVTAFLGRGGSGEVYRVVHNTLGTAAALKVCVRKADRDADRRNPKKQMPTCNGSDSGRMPQRESVLTSDRS